MNPEREVGHSGEECMEQERENFQATGQSYLKVQQAERQKMMHLRNHHSKELR